MIKPRASIGDVIEFFSSPVTRTGLIRGVIIDIVEDIDYITDELVPVYKACCIGDGLVDNSDNSPFMLHLYDIDWDNYSIKVVNNDL